ncbi:phosphoglycerate kinase [bacterium]|nr:phosphoglycerate kinase [bacterium]
MKSLGKLEPDNKKVLVRLDFDVPIEKGKIIDTFRLDASLPTLKYLQPAEKIFLVGHSGRPEGKVTEDLSLRPQADYLAQKLGLSLREAASPFFYRRYLLGDKIEILENLRFFIGEEHNEKKFAQKYAGLADVFVFEAFAVSHRKHASVYWLPKILPSYLGFRAEKEIEILSRLKRESSQTLAVIGGGKAKDKADLVHKFAAQNILLGGKTANELYLNKESLPKNVVLPIDGVLPSGKVKDYVDMSKKEVLSVRDLGPKTIKLFSEFLDKKGKNIIFAGPVGQFEKKSFSLGTKILYQRALGTKKFTFLLGGDSSYAALKFCLREKFSYVSVGGGASLSFLSRKSLEFGDVLT